MKNLFKRVFICLIWFCDDFDYIDRKRKIKQCKVCKTKMFYLPE